MTNKQELQESSARRECHNDRKGTQENVNLRADNAQEDQHDEDRIIHRLPLFQRRPLNDTPIESVETSPEISEEDNSGRSSREKSPRTPPNVKNSSANEIDGESKDSVVVGNDLIRDSASQDTIISDRDSTLISVPSLLEKIDHSEDERKKDKAHRRHTTTLDVPGLTRSKISPDGLISQEEPGSKLIIVMVGLPATGKSFITNKISRYLNYSLYYCKIFNVGNTRRKYATKYGIGDQDSKFFDPNNAEANTLRDKWALDTLDELLDYLLNTSGCVAIFDATNTTKLRRKMLMDRIRSRNEEINVLFLESICSDQAVVEANIRLKLFGPDYKGKDPEESMNDFKQRLDNYLTAYETLDDEEDLQYIKMIDIGKKFVSYKIQGFLASQTLYYLLNFNLSYRKIWITRNGESENNVEGRLGGDSKLTVRGQRYARALAKFIDRQRSNEEKNKNKMMTTLPGSKVTDYFVWTSMRQRAIETSKYFDESEYPNKQMRMLDEINAGLFEGLTYQEIQDNFPIEFEKRQEDKLKYRYPGIGGESYLDVINRLRPVVNEIERIEENVVIITHRVVARSLLGYFMNIGFDNITDVDIPLHCIYCLEPMPYGIKWTLYEYDEDRDVFYKVPQSSLNITKVKQIGLVNDEKRYTMVPTAPPSRTSSMISTYSGGDNKNISKTPSIIISREQEKENVRRKPMKPVRSRSTSCYPGGGYPSNSDRDRDARNKESVLERGRSVLETKNPWTPSQSPLKEGPLRRSLTGERGNRKKSSDYYCYYHYDQERERLPGGGGGGGSGVVPPVLPFRRDNTIRMLTKSVNVLETSQAATAAARKPTEDPPPWHQHHRGSQLLQDRQ